MKSIIKLSMALGILVGISACNTKAEKVLNSTEVHPEFCLNEQLKKSTEIVEVSEQPIQEQITLTGKIEYNENDLVAFKSLLEGVVEQVDFELGDYVKKGQVLATIKSGQIQDLHQQKKFHQNQIELFKKQIQSKKELLNDGLVSATEVLSLEHELSGAQIELDKINFSLQLYKATGNNSFQILSPKNGYIIRKSVSSGQTITVDSEPLFSISNLQQVWVMVNIYASTLRYIHTGDVVNVRTVAYPDNFYTGKIDKIYNVFDDDEHVLKARVVLENKNLNLMPGLSADIIINKKNVLGHAFAVPNKSTVFSNNKEYVVVYKDDCQLEARRITRIATNEEYTYIQEKLAPGEKVISSNALLLFEELNK